MGDIEGSDEVLAELNRQVEAAGGLTAWARAQRRGTSLLVLASKARNGLGVGETLALALGFRKSSRYERLPS